MEHSELLLTAAEAFDAVGAEYAIVGGAAAIIYGTVRTTMDVDLVCDLRHEMVAPESGDTRLIS